MAHKAECPRSKDKAVACTCGGSDDAPVTRVCWDCGETIGASEKTCPKCKADPKLSDEEDGVVERAIERLKKKRKAQPAPPAPPGPADPPKKHVFSSLSKLLK